MKIHLAKSAGFCFGVKRALTIALKTAASRAKVCMLGDIVHNEGAVRQIKQAGIKKIKKLCPGRDRTLLIRAHGRSLATLQKGRRLGYRIIDATCPMVKQIHKIVRDMEQKGYKIIIIGDKKHDEVHGINGQLKQKAIIIDGLRNIPLKKIKGIAKAAIVVQSTQELKRVLEIVGTLKKYLKELRFFNTICRPTRQKQEEAKTMAQANDAMIIIGSKTSANTRRLYEISKALNKNTYWVSSRGEIKTGWLKNVQNVGITAGSSTPDSTTLDIVNYLQLL